MSKAKFVEFGGRGFRAYDVALGVFLKHLVDAAEASGQAGATWLSRAVSAWRVAACIQDLGLTLESGWSEAQRAAFVGFAEDACARLATRNSIPAGEIVSWKILEDQQIFPRGDEEVLTAPVVELGRAIVALITGRLPDAPKGKIWLYGTPAGRETIGWNG